MRVGRAAGIAAATLTALLMGGLVNVAEGAAGSGSTPSAGNSCANPVLAQNAQGRSTSYGGSRVAVTGHVVARYGYRVPTYGSTATVTLPGQAVKAGQAWSFAFDSTITGNGGTVRAGVGWYTSAGKKIAHADGAAVRVGPAWPTGHRAHRRHEGDDHRHGRPEGRNAMDEHGGRLRRPGRRDDSGPDDDSGPHHDARPHHASGHHAAADDGAAHDDRPRRRHPGGDPARLGTGRRRGRVREHPVLLLWPDAENWPVGGEIDYAEMTIAAADSDFFLHHGANNSQNHSYAATDLTQWHDYAVEWTATGIRGYIDGTKFFEDTNLSHLPPGAMHQTIQLDWFPSGTTATTPSSMNVARVRQYAV